MLAEQLAKPTTRAEDILSWVPGYWEHYAAQAETDDPVLDPDRSRGGIRPGQYFTARFMSNTGWKRGSFLALAADEAPAMRDVVTIRMLADPQPAPQREHPRQRIGLTLASRIKSATGLDAESPIRVEVIDASAGGVCVETAATLAVGDVLFLEGPDPAATGADFEILRADPALRNRYGGRFLEEQAGRTLYENLVAAAQAERAARRARPAPTAAAPDPTDQSAAPRGMRHRDE